jgi:hypothetical protein
MADKADQDVAWLGWKAKNAGLEVTEAMAENFSERVAILLEANRGVSDQQAREWAWLGLIRSGTCRQMGNQASSPGRCNAT